MIITVIDRYQDWVWFKKMAMQRASNCEFISLGYKVHRVLIHLLSIGPFFTSYLRPQSVSYKY